MLRALQRARRACLSTLLASLCFLFMWRCFLLRHRDAVQMRCVSGVRASYSLIVLYVKLTSGSLQACMFEGVEGSAQSADSVPVDASSVALFFVHVALPFVFRHHDTVQIHCVLCTRAFYF